MGDDAKLVQAVLDEMWHSDRSNCIFVNGAEHGDDSAVFRDAKNPHSTRTIVIDAERARQAAMGHRLLRLTNATYERMMTVAEQDELRAIIAELRRGGG